MGDAIGVVAALWRYPVKSLQGDAIERAEIGPGGIAGDRAWAIVDVATGKVLTAKRWAALLEASATERDGVVELTLPDGSTHVAGDPDTDVAVSQWLDREVRVQQPSADVSTPYELTMDTTDDDSEVWDFATPPGSFVDLAHTHVLTTSSITAAGTGHPGGQWDVHRFRPNVLVDTGDAEGFLEDGWLGGTVRLGEAVLEPFMATPRCAMPGRGQPAHALDRDKEILRTLQRAHENNLGIYASVARPGVIAVGDQVSLA